MTALGTCRPKSAKSHQDNTSQVWGAGRGAGPGQSILLQASEQTCGSPLPQPLPAVIWGKWLDLSTSVSLFVNEQWLSPEVAMEIK